MPSKWEWWVGLVGDESFFSTARDRGDAIKIGMREAEPGEQFKIVEARSSTAAKYADGNHDFVPFTHMRNHEILTNGPRLISEDQTNA